MIDKAVESRDSEKILEKFPTFLTRIEAMIEKTESSSVPDEQKKARLDILYILLDAIQDVLDSL